MTPAVTRIAKLIPRTLLSIILIIYLVNIAWPYLYRENVQDSCSFGTVSNAQYLGYLEDVKQRAREYWPPLPDGSHPWPVDDEMQNSLAYRLNDATKDLDGFYERLAMSHAMMRAAGMRLREKQGVTKASLDADGKANSLRYVYGFTSPNYSLIPMRMFRFDGKGTVSFISDNEAGKESANWLQSDLTVKTDDGQLAITFEELGFLKSDPDDQSDITIYPRLTDYDKTYRPCPEVPSAEWVAAYEASKPQAPKAPEETETSGAKAE